MAANRSAVVFIRSRLAEGTPYNRDRVSSKGKEGERAEESNYGDPIPRAEFGQCRGSALIPCIRAKNCSPLGLSGGYSERLNSGMAIAIMTTPNRVRMTKSCQIAVNPASF